MSITQGGRGSLAADALGVRLKRRAGPCSVRSVPVLGVTAENGNGIPLVGGSCLQYRIPSVTLSGRVRSGGL